MPSALFRAGVSQTTVSRYRFPIVVSDWTGGMFRDGALLAIPEGRFFDSTDFLFDNPHMARKRGGTSYAGPALGAATYAATVSFAEFPAGSQLLAIGDDGHFYKVASGSTTDLATLGAGFPSLQSPVLRIGATSRLVIPANDGTTVPKSYDGTTVAALGGSPPAGKFSAVYATRLVLAGTSANPNRLFFSPTPDITAAWDTANSYIDADYAVTGLAATASALLVFSQSHLERITGFTPPPGSDMARVTLASIGCSDARSISVKDNVVVFANPRGVYITSGAGTPESLTDQGGISSYWWTQLTGYDPATWTIATGLYGPYIFVSVMNGATLIDTLMCNIPKRAWWRLTNIKARMFTPALTNAAELYYADRSAARVVSTSGIFSPAAANKNDANGTAVAPAMQMAPVGIGPFLELAGHGKLSYDMRDAAADSPTLAVQVAPGAEATTFAAVNESPLAATTDETRKRLSINKVSQAVSVKLVQSGPSAKTEVYFLEVERRPLTLSAGGQ